jgi:uncharacterized protein YjdB
MGSLANLTFSHNLWSAAPPAGLSGNGDVTGDPKLAKTGNTGAGELTANFFKLLETSPAIDAGMQLSNVARDFFQNLRDATPDIGAHEYGVSNQGVLVTEITVTGANGASTITSNDGTLQLVATVSPVNATNKTVTWTVQNSTGRASVSANGLVTAVANGTVTVTATANDGSGTKGSLLITITDQTIAVTSITVTGAGGATTIDKIGGTLQLTATVIPANATNKNVTWSIQNGTGQASISETGLVTAISAGTVNAKATAIDGSGVSGSLMITISADLVYITQIIVYGENSATKISTPGGTLQLKTNILPSNATNKTVTWSVQNGTGQASISSTGLLTAIADGSVTVKATANDGSGVYGFLIITIENQNISTDERDNGTTSPFLTVSESRVIIHLNEFTSYKTIRLYNMLGKLVVYKKLSDMVDYIEISSLQPGIYVAVLSADNKVWKNKLIIY